MLILLIFKKISVKHPHLNYHNILLVVPSGKLVMHEKNQLVQYTVQTIAESVFP